MAAAIAQQVVKSCTSAAARPVVSSQRIVMGKQVLKPGQEIVIPRWWSGKYVIEPSRFTVDGRGKLTKDDLHSDSMIGQEMRAKFDDVGAIHVKNTGLQQQMGLQRDLARIIMGQETEYEGGANPRERTSDLSNVYDIGAPLTADLAYHHEMTYKSDSITKLGFLCKHAVNRGSVGWSYISDSVQAHDYIMQTDLGQKLKDKGLCFIRRMTDAKAFPETNGNGSSGNVIYNHWQKSWMTDDLQAAQEAAESQGLQVEWIDDPVQGRMMQTRYYKSAFEYIEALDRNIMVTSIADDGEWFDSWPGIQDVPQEQRPLEMMFGDDTPFSLSEKQEWTDVYDRFGIPIPWSGGDVAVICNMRFAHGRPGIHLLPNEQRELGVMLGPFFERQETKDDKW